MALDFRSRQERERDRRETVRLEAEAMAHVHRLEKRLETARENQEASDATIRELQVKLGIFEERIEKIRRHIAETDAIHAANNDDTRHDLETLKSKLLALQTYERQQPSTTGASNDNDMAQIMALIKDL